MGPKKTWTYTPAGQQPHQQPGYVTNPDLGHAGYAHPQTIPGETTGVGVLGVGKIDSWESQQQQSQQQLQPQQSCQSQYPQAPHQASTNLWGAQQEQSTFPQSQQKPIHQPTAPAVSSSLFSGGGISNWEHFDISAEEVDDEAMIAEQARKQEQEKAREREKELERERERREREREIEMEREREREREKEREREREKEREKELERQKESERQKELEKERERERARERVLELEREQEREKERERERVKEMEKRERERQRQQLLPHIVTAQSQPPLQHQQTWNSQAEVIASPGFPSPSVLQKFHYPPTSTGNPFGVIQPQKTFIPPVIPGGGGYWPEIGDVRTTSLIKDQIEVQPKQVQAQIWPQPPAGEEKELAQQFQSEPVLPSGVPPNIEQVLPALSQYVPKPEISPPLARQQLPYTSPPAHAGVPFGSAPIPTLPAPPPKPPVLSIAVQTEPTHPPTPPTPPTPKPILISTVVQTDPIRPPTPPLPPPPEFFVPSTLDQWYKDSIHRYISMILAESSAYIEKDKLTTFTDFMMEETTLRGEKYSSAVGEEGKLAKLEKRGTFWGDGDYRHLYGGGRRKENRVSLSEYESSDDDDDAGLGGIAVELEKELGISTQRDKEPKEVTLPSVETDIKPLFSGRKVHSGVSAVAGEKPHLGEGMLQKAKEIHAEHELKRTTTLGLIPSVESSPSQVPTELSTSVVTTSIPPLSPSNKSTLSQASATTPSVLPPIPSPLKSASSLATPPPPGNSQYKPFRTNTPPGKASRSPSGLGSYQAYHPPTPSSPKAGTVKPTEGYKAYRPPSGSVDMGKRDSWVGPAATAIPKRPLSTMGLPSSLMTSGPPDRRMTMTTAPSTNIVNPAVISQTDLGISTEDGFRRPERTHTMTWDGDGAVHAQAHPHSMAKPIGGFFALPGVLGFDEQPERGRQVERARTPLPYPVDDPVAPASQPSSLRMQNPPGPTYRRTPSPAARSRANSSAPIPPNYKPQSPVPPQLGTRSRANSQAPVAPPYPIKPLSPQLSSQSTFRKPDNSVLRPTQHASAVGGHTPSPAPVGSQPTAAAAVAALNQVGSGRKTATPVQQEPIYSPPAVPVSPPPRATLSPAPLSQKHTLPAPGSPRPTSVSPRHQVPFKPPPTVSPVLAQGPTPPLQPPQNTSPKPKHTIVQNPKNPVNSQEAIQAPKAPPQPSPSAPENATAPAPPRPPTVQAQDTPTATTSELRTLLPSQINPLPEDFELLALPNAKLNSLPRDFSFIATLVKEYNALAAAARAKSEDSRRRRQEAHDKTVDQAYTAKDIEYADFANLDEEFQEQEASLKQAEEQAEYDMYAAEVFGKVYEELQGHINTLLEGWNWLVNTGLKVGVVGRAVWNVDGQPNKRRASPALVDVLGLILRYYHEIETRYAKITEAVLERDRRYKKMVIRSLYETGEVKKMKSEEKRFEEREKETLHKAALERKERTVEMWKLLEDGLMHGLDHDLAYTEALTNAVKAVLDEIPSHDAELTTKSRQWGTEITTELDKAYRLLDELVARTIRQFEFYHEGNMCVVKANFEEKLAQGKLSGTIKKEETEKWENERKVEEENLQKELQERKGKVSVELEELRGGLVTALGRVKGWLARGEAGEDRPLGLVEQGTQPLQSSAPPASPPKTGGVWGWFKG